MAEVTLDKMELEDLMQSYGEEFQYFIETKGEEGEIMLSDVRE